MAPKNKPVKTGPPPHGYIATVGFNHDPTDTRIEPGQPVEGLPGKVAADLAAQGVIRPATKDEADAWTEPDPEPTDDKEGDS